MSLLRTVASFRCAIPAKPGFLLCALAGFRPEILSVLKVVPACGVV